jgi:putative addiction module component (TIGR02574 family)
MRSTAHALRAEVLALPEAERAEMALDLLRSLEDHVGEGASDLSNVWAQETARRVAQIDGGEVTLESWDDLMAKVAASRRAQ